MDVEIRPATADEMQDFFRVTGYAFWQGAGGDGAVPDDVQILPDWTLCAVVDGRIATTSGSWPFRVRLNGQSVAMGGVTMVATLPEFRRRGLLRQVMTKALADHRDRGQSIAILWASMGAIYQRYGYGLASTMVSYDIDPREIAFASGERASGSVRLLPGEQEARPVIEQLYKEFNRPRNLLIQRAGPLWDIRFRRGANQQTHFGVYHNAAGEPRGYVAVQPSIDGSLDRGQVLNVADWVALDGDAYRGLWEFLAAHDLVGRVRWERVPEDDPAPLLLLEPRALHRRTGDAIWMRITDVAAALPQRPYGDADALTLRVIDELCPWNDGAYVLETTGAQTEVSRLDGDGDGAGDADLTMPVSSLAVLLAGHRSATTLARAGLVSPRDDRALTRADRLFATAHAPWCADGF